MFAEFVLEHAPRFASGAWVTAQQTLLASLLALAVAFPLGLLRLARNPFARGVATAYVELFRGTSLLVQLYWIFFVLPLLGLSLAPFTAGFVAVGMNLGAYGAEVVRGAIQAVPRGQYEAALALNLPPWTRMRRILLPQALVLMLPQWGNLLVELLKGTALVSLISVGDLMFEAKQINGSTFRSAEAFGTALILYYVLARFLITPGMRRLETVLARRLGRV